MGYKTPTCSIARSCGGCEWLSVPYPIQLKRKQAQVEELLAPLASINNVTIEPIRGMDELELMVNMRSTSLSIR